MALRLVALVAGALLIVGCGSADPDATASDAGAETTTTIDPLTLATPLEADPDWVGPDPDDLAAAGAVAAALESDLDQELILAGCPFDGIFDGLQIAGFAEPEGSILCLAGHADTEVTLEGSIVVGVSVPFDFETVMADGYTLGDEVEIGPGVARTACAGERICVARWRHPDVDVIVVDFVVDDPDEATSLLPSVIEPAVVGAAAFDLETVGIDS